MAQTHYSTLGVPEDATGEEIKKRYRFMSQAFHPDKFRDQQREAASLEFKRINEAYQVLSNPGSRASYDRSLKPPEPRPAPSKESYRPSPPKPAESPGPPKPKGEKSPVFAAFGLWGLLVLMVLGLYLLLFIWGAIFGH